MSNTNTLPAMRFSNNFRVVSGTYLVADSDSELLCDTSTSSVTIELALIPSDKWNTQYKLYIIDNSNNAATNNITINAPAGYQINGASSYVINTNGQAISIFIASNVNYGIANAVNAPVTNQVSDEAFAADWAGVTDIAPSKNAVYNKIITIGAGFGNTAFTRKGGNDNVAVVGNFLQPFGTIEAAIYGYTDPSTGINAGNGLMGPLTNPALPFNQSTNPYTGTGVGFQAGSALNVDSGVFNIGDLLSIYEQCPQGLKPQGSNFDIYCNVGCTINYYGTYGLYVIDSTRSGSLYGNGKLVNYSSTISGGYPISCAQASIAGVRTIQAAQLLNEATSGVTSFIRIGNCGSTTGYIIEVTERCYSRCQVNNSTTMLFTTGSRATTIGSATFDAIGNDNGGGNADNYAISLSEPTDVTFNGITITARGDYLTNVNTKVMSIKNDTNGKITLNNCNIYAVETGATPSYKVIDFVTTGITVMTNLFIRDCILKNRADSSFASDGYSMFSDNNITMKIANTYAEKAQGGAGTITNTLTVLEANGDGFLVEPNL